MTHATLRGKERYWLPLLAFFLLSRILLLALAPHDDPSEARYAEIARKMVETGDWITPQHAYGVPFWAKPPLSMWMSALGMEIFGVNEFGSRIFIFLGALGILLLIGRFAWKQWSPSAGMAVVVILAAMPLFYYCSAAVMTDLALAAGTTLSMVSFIRAVRGESRRWGYLFFAGLAIGLLAKGPLVLVLVSVPLAGWAIATREWKALWTTMPWFSGTVLTALAVLPWYILAEQKTPGFLNYFIIGEHWNRFFKTGWTGDLYGKAHAEAPGTIWLYGLLATFPWCLGFFAIPFRKWRSLGTWALKDHGLGLYLALWAIWPVLFFTPARNVIATYPLPSLPAIALLLTLIHHESPSRKFHPLHPGIVTASVALVIGFLALTLLLPDKSPKHSERALVRAFDHHRVPGDELLYFGRRKYSAEFYSHGSVVNTRSIEVLAEHLAKPGTLHVAISSRRYAELPMKIRQKLRLVASFDPHDSLYQESAPNLPEEFLEAFTH